ncbi:MULTISPECIES: peptidoglycan DD-metalloendopeptidase family protein [Halomonas]|uniref:peptidoglycan DD-metalloendopeptidase family protein n=1 Tax=Halomonas TaxID=2745 RepID=UPI001C97C5A3|nr:MULTISPECIES: peptidoglycan DD-metalloendopeptidase family protein [Halomonas]MBY5984165.1 peptidoglycan DD-metalloendopeptidase family protein [Halomonas sp. DP5Y7-2]MBY6207737.1 peptidoglycan DD-metalloendopeptidase family protein [Halomonas sp. DP3Y7-2]MBY6228546.1 peptidoglycan DD-metalloendopeptidase family protein [Halomonas sp. DP3Y7-1]MCA0916612.1 peptidoglycan DD-metalloendopeptidase family protein [Halomonas denitrificans]
MHKIFVISSLALALAGCANQQGASQPVQVQDLSSARAAQVPAQYTVQSGDTLYGIAWRHDMDFRELARLNNITPPYRIDVGQTLRLSADGSQAGGMAATGAVASANEGAVATPLGQSTPASQPSGEDLEWLLPDGSTETVSNGAEQVSSAAVQGAAGVAGASAGSPGPVYDYDSPGAEGLSDSDQAERARREAEESVVAAADEEAREMSENSESAQSGSASEADSSTAQAASEEASSSGSGSASASTTRTYTPVDEVPWQWPADGQVVSQFGESSSITAGIDIGGQKGQPVRAAGPGKVVYAGSGVRGYGKLILLKHNDEYLSAYAHNDSLKVSENDVVEAGQVIATMGDSDAEDVRLHFEVRKDGQPQDPTKYLPSR